MAQSDQASGDKDGTEDSEVLVDNKYTTSTYLPGRKVVYHTIHRPVGGQISRDALNRGTETLRKHKACKWLSGERNNGPLSAGDMDWGFNDWNRRTVEAGWKYWAVVVPEEIAAACSLAKTIMDLSNLSLRMMVLTDLKEAFKWLERMEE